MKVYQLPDYLFPGYRFFIALRKTHLHNSIVETDYILIFHYIGEMTQIARALAIKCLCVQASDESAKALVDSLGLHNEEEGIEELEENTEDLIKELSQMEKEAVTATRLTRSKGHSLAWNRALNADTPIC